MKVNNTILEKWRQQLLEERDQSVLFNALSKQETVDFCRLKNTQGNHYFPFTWIKQLLKNGPMKYEISSEDGYILEKLKQLYFDNQCNVKEQGVHSLSFAYPVLYYPNPNYPAATVAAPLFIWQLNLYPHPSKPDVWIIDRDPRQAVLSNPVLVRFLQHKFHVLTASKFESIIQNETLNADVLLKLANQLSMELDMDGHLSSINIERIGSDHFNGRIGRKSQKSIQWFGLLGNFPTISYKAVRFLDNLMLSDSHLVDESSLSENPTFQEHSFGLMPLEGYQEQVLQSLDLFDRVFVEGAPGTGKTFSLAATLINALANKARSVVMANNKDALEEIKNYLKEHGLEHFALVLTDPNQIAPAFLEAYQLMAEKKKQTPRKSTTNLQLLINNAIRQQTALNANHRMLHKRILNEDSWIEITGKFLHNHFLEGKQLLGSQLSKLQLAFNEPEYEKIRNNIAQSEHLYQEVNTLNHPLKKLHYTIFINNDRAAAKQTVQQQSEAFLNEANELFRNFTNTLENYTESLEGNYYNHHNELFQKLDKLKHDIRNYTAEYGSDFDNTGSLKKTKLRLFGVFSDKHRELIEVKEQLLQDYNALQAIHSEKYFFHYKFPLKTKNFDRISKDLAAFESTLLAWKQNVPNIVLDEIKELNSQTSNPQILAGAEFGQLENQFNSFLQNLNESQLYDKHFHCKEAHLIGRKIYLEQTIEDLENLQYHLRDFDRFYPWQRNWILNDPLSNEVLTALIKMKPDNWMAAFESWYFHNLLSNFHSDVMLQDDKLLQEHASTLNQIKQSLPFKILSYWYKEQETVLKNLKKQDKNLYNFLNRQKSDYELYHQEITKLIQEAPDFFSSHFPILLITPQVLNTIIPQQDAFYDLVLIDSADSINFLDALPALHLAKQKIVFAQPPVQDQALADYIRQNRYKKIHLGIQHRIHQKQLFSFLNNTFYEGSLNLSYEHELNPNQSIHIAKTNGLYDLDQKHNRIEAQRILTILNQIAQERTGKYPQVGIACMTKEQRNLVLEIILDCIREKGVAYQKIRSLQQAGLSVFEASQSSGRQFDLLIFSTTYGPYNKDGDLCGALKDLQDIRYRGLFELLVTRAKKGLYICTSIPANYYNNHATDNSSPNFLAKLLTYASAVDIHDQKLQHFLLQKFQTESPNSPLISLQADSFVEEVAKNLSNYIRNDRIHTQRKVDNIPVHIIVEPLHKKQPATIVQCDGFSWQQPCGSYHQEASIRNYLVSKGYEYINIWSVNWWKHPDVQARKLAGMLIDYDKAYEAQK